jgi:hypothetical protein
MVHYKFYQIYYSLYDFIVLWFIISFTKFIIYYLLFITSFTKFIVHYMILLLYGSLQVLPNLLFII